MTLLFFSVKADFFLFSNLMMKGPCGDLQSVNFNLNINLSKNMFRISKNFKLKLELCNCPAVPPSSYLKKATSQLFTGKE